MVEPFLGTIPGLLPRKALKVQEQTNGVSDSDGVILAEAIHSGQLDHCSNQFAPHKWVMKKNTG